MVVYHLYSDARTAVLHQPSSVVLFHELWSMVIEIKNVDSDKTCRLKLQGKKIQYKYSVCIQLTTNCRFQSALYDSRWRSTSEMLNYIKLQLNYISQFYLFATKFKTITYNEKNEHRILILITAG